MPRPPPSAALTVASAASPMWMNDHTPPAPRTVPRWLARLLAGEAATMLMTEAVGASNAKAKHELGWRPAHATWRDGFATAL